MRSVSRAAAQLLAKQGLPLNDRPEDGAPDIPTDITSLADAELMTLFSRLVGWTDYASTQLAVAQVDERAAQRRVDARVNELMSQASSGRTGDRITILKAAIAVDASVVELEDIVEGVHAYRKLVEALAANFERDAALASRELTRRTNSVPQTRKDRFIT
jgi:hypothetical protein